MAKRTFKVTVKNGDDSYGYNKKGEYTLTKKDYVVGSGDLADALLAFLDYATDEYNENKVTLTLVPGKKTK